MEKFKKVKSFQELHSHPLVMYVDMRDYDASQPREDRTAILIGLYEPWKCSYMGTSIISALSKKDAIRYFNNIHK
jgi:hypothetical protein